MKTKVSKLTVAALTIALLCLALTAYALVTLKTITNNMQVAGIAALQVESPPGTPISSYDWGTFSNIGETKQATFYLHNIGNTELSFNATVTDLPDGWTVSMDKTSWILSPDATTNLTVTLQLTKALPIGSYSFNLAFYIP
ncbi:MAG: hypothetical protein QXN36_00725 [Candidatus Bathyarchaeia archaeon]